MWKFLLIIFGSATFYGYTRFKPLFPDFSTWKGYAACIAYFFIMLSYFFGSMLQMRGHYTVAQPLIIIGAWAIAILLYTFLTFLLIDIIRGINAFTFKADFLTFKYNFFDEKAKLFSTIGGIIVAIIVICGYFNAKFPITKEITYKTDKKLSHPIKFVLISDVHLGMINGDKFFSILAQRINLINPDFVAIAGDFFDGDPQPVIKSNADKIIKSINTKYGIYAIPGNHEYIGNADTALKFMQQNGVNVLRDQAKTLPCGVTIIGRDDLMANRVRGKRATLEQLTQNVDNETFTIMMDHQPYHLEEAEQNNIDLQLSGHTHHGQLWPGNLITNAIYECSFGQHKRGKTEYYVSAGYGTWGPPIRTTCRPEMVVITIEN